jgi:hypothetical protein
MEPKSRTRRRHEGHEEDAFEELARPLQHALPNKNHDFPNITIFKLRDLRASFALFVSRFCISKFICVDLRSSAVKIIFYRASARRPMSLR